MGSVACSIDYGRAAPNATDFLRDFYAYMKKAVPAETVTVPFTGMISSALGLNSRSTLQIKGWQFLGWNSSEYATAYVLDTRGVLRHSPAPRGRAQWLRSRETFPTGSFQMKTGL